MADKDCRNCPNFIPKDKVMAETGRDLGTDLCRTYGHILSRAGTGLEGVKKVQTYMAATCPSFGTKTDPVAPFAGVARINPMVAIGDQSIQVNIDVDTQPATCLSCENFIPPGVVRENFGWIHGMCGAKGHLIFNQNYSREASVCNHGRVGQPRTNAAGVTLFAQFGETPVTMSPTKNGQPLAATSTIAKQIDPREYPTDKPVDQKGYDAGLRAWRKIEDPEDVKEALYMPIFDGERLCGFDPRTTYGNHRPDLYFDHANRMYDMVAEWIYKDATPCLIGGAGTGKTELFCYMAYMMDLPFERLSVSKDTEGWHFVGESGLEVVQEKVEQPDGSIEIVSHTVTTFKEGRLASRVQTPCVICIDEPNLKSDIFELIRPLIDTARQLVIDAAQGLVIRKHKFCFLGCAQNPSDDPIYIGTEPMNAADMDRISPIHMPLPDPKIEKQIIVNHCNDAKYEIPAKTLDQIMAIAADIRSGIKNGELPIAWGLRSQIKVARNTQFYSIEKAYRRAILDGLEDQVVDVILPMIRSVVS